jgi:hypothetical protein
MQRHWHQEFLRFLNRLERDIPAGRLIHLILDNYGSHKHPKVRAWLARHPRWTFLAQRVGRVLCQSPAAVSKAASFVPWSSLRQAADTK